MLTEKSFDTGEIVLSYDEGSAAGPPMVLLHGLTGMRQAWQENLIPALGDSWHLYVCDLRGHGKSGRAASDEDYRVADYGHDFAVFLRERVPEPAVVVGHSLGALTAIATASEAIDRVRALILLDPPIYTRNLSVHETPDYKNWFTFVYDTMQPEPTFEEVVACCRGMNPEADEEALHGMAYQVSQVAPGTVGVVLQDRLLEGYDLAAGLRRITCPTLLLRGEWRLGGTLRDEDVDFVRANLPHATIIQIPDGTHGFPWEQRDLTLQHIDTFLKTLD